MPGPPRPNQRMYKNVTNVWMFQGGKRTLVAPSHSFSFLVLSGSLHLNPLKVSHFSMGIRKRAAQKPLFCARCLVNWVHQWIFLGARWQVDADWVARKWSSGRLLQEATTQPAVVKLFGFFPWFLQGVNGLVWIGLEFEPLVTVEGKWGGLDWFGPWRVGVSLFGVGPPFLVVLKSQQRGPRKGRTRVQAFGFPFRIW